MATYVTHTYSCPSCRRVIAVNAWPALASPLGACRWCGAPVICNWCKEWEQLSTSARSDFYMRASAIPLLLGLVGAYGFMGAGRLAALAAAAVVAGIALIVNFLRLRLEDQGFGPAHGEPFLSPAAPKRRPGRRQGRNARSGRLRDCSRYGGGGCVCVSPFQNEPFGGPGQNTRVRHRGGRPVHHLGFDRVGAGLDRGQALCRTCRCRCHLHRRRGRGPCQP